MTRKEIFPSELVILMACAKTGAIGKNFVTRPMDMPGEYIGYLYNSLVRRDYIKGGRSIGYQLTSKGREALFEFLCENGMRFGDAINTLQQLGIAISQEIDKLEKEVVEVK